MAQHGSIDRANNAPIWAPAQFKQTPNVANRDLLFGNTTANNVGTGETVGVYGVSASEIQVTGANGTLYSVTITAPGTGYTAMATATFANGGVANAAPTVNATGTPTMRLVSVTVGHGGNNYAPGDLLQVSGGTMTTNAVINVVTTEVRAATVNAAGSGYTNGDVIRLTTGTGTAANATVTTNGTGNVTSVSLVNNGVYTVNPTSLNSANTANVTGTGTGLTLVVVPKILSVAISNSGVFTSLPTLTNNQVANLTGTGVSANINLVVGVAGITITNTGSGYVTAPAITFGGAGGSGTTATATIYTPTSVHAGRAVAHSGWVVKKEGTGGRAGRVQYETLVAGGISSDSTDDGSFPE